jgi:Ca2+-binding EF-hand superfamily protein
MKKLVFAVALGATTISTQAFAQEASVGRQITRQEAQQFADSMFQRLDANHDGVVTRDEAQQAAAQFSQGHQGKGGGRAEKMIDRIFGAAPQVTQQQFDALALAHFDQQDANHDGVVTSDERHSGRTHGQY